MLPHVNSRSARCCFCTGFQNICKHGHISATSPGPRSCSPKQTLLFRHRCLLSHKLPHVISRDRSFCCFYPNPKSMNARGVYGTGLGPQFKVTKTSISRFAWRVVSCAPNVATLHSSPCSASRAQRVLLAATRTL